MAKAFRFWGLGDIATHYVSCCGLEHVDDATFLVLWPSGHISPVKESLAGLTAAVYDLIKLYLRSFCPPLPSGSEGQPTKGQPNEVRDSKEASDTSEHLQFTLVAVHGITNVWVSRYGAALPAGGCVGIRNIKHLLVVIKAGLGQAFGSLDEQVFS